MFALAPTPLDLGVLVLFLAFGAWGAWRGALRQVLALGALAVAFPLASRYGPSLESPVAKAVTATGTDLQALAWGVGFVLVLLGGWILLALLQPLLERLRLPGRAERAAGGLLGLAHGAALLTVLGIGVLVGHPSAPRPDWVRRLEAAPVARAMRAIRRTALDPVRLPAWLERRVEDAESRIGKSASAVVQPEEGGRACAPGTERSSDHGA